MTSESEEYKHEFTLPSLPRTTRGLPLPLSASPDGNKFVYCAGNSVFIRDANQIFDCDVYTEHSTLTQVAKYAPSGFYIASGDKHGKIRIWDTTQSTHILKAEYSLINGPIRDIAWSEDSKRMAVVGEGKERFGHVFLFDTGTSNGNLSGQSKAMTSIDFRWTRPYRLVSSSEDNTVAIFEGPPFKFKTLFHEHTRFAQCIRYNKDGSIFASAGADGRVILFEGTEGTKIGELVDSSDTACKEAAHAGGVFALCWNSDGKRLVTASGDKTLKIWNVADKKIIGTIRFGTTVDDQQLGVVWLRDRIVSCSLSGFLNYVDPETLTITKILKGHNKSITAMALASDGENVFTADFEGNITRWKLSDGSSEHNAQPISHKLTSQPRGVDSTKDGKTVAVATQRAILIFTDKRLLKTNEIKYEGMCIAISPEGNLLAVGGNDANVHVYALSTSDSSLTEKQKLSHGGALTSVNFSPDGKYLVATDIAKKVVPYNVNNGFKVASEKSWSFHTARINCSAWSSNSRYIVTGSLDTNIMVWDLEQSGEHPLLIRGAHQMSAINCVAFLPDGKRILSVGQDANIRIWNKLVFFKMSENLRGVNDDLVSTLCSCSTINFEDSLNRIKLLEVEKDKMNMAFQLILAKLDLGLCQDQTIIKQLQELNEKMGGNEKILNSLQKMQLECFENKNKLEIEVEKQKEEIKSLELDKLGKEGEIKILKENLEENKNELDDYKNKVVKLGEERYLVENELFKFKEEFEKLKEENKKIFEEKLQFLKELEGNKLKIEKYEEDKKLELINLAKLKNENEGIFKVKNKLLEENKIKIMKIEEENKKLAKKLKDSENLIFPLRHEISQNKRNYEQALKVNLFIMS
uniref:Uncharacterized protein n=1 Tax=Meloidogyne javanica TaxID=6303 RepID=A0A915LJA8_MELJA